MPPTILKLALVLVLCIQATLWSHSRQGTVHLESYKSSTSLLLPRADSTSQEYGILSKEVNIVAVVHL